MLFKFEDPEVNCVYIPLPTTLKKHWTIKSTEYKKHVLCEKPLAATSKDVREMIVSARKHQVTLLDGTFFVHHFRTEQVLKEIESLKNENEEVITVFSRFTWLIEDETNIRHNKETEPLGVLGDLGWYCIRGILLAFLGELPLKVFGTATYNHKEVPVSFNGILTFSKNRIAHFDCSFGISTLQSLEISSKNKTLKIEDFVLPWEAEPLKFPERKFNPVSGYKIMKYPGMVDNYLVNVT